MLKRPASEPSLAPPWLHGLEYVSSTLCPSVCLIIIARKLFSLPRVLENTASRIPERAHDCAISERALSLLSSPYASMSLSSFISSFTSVGTWAEQTGELGTGIAEPTLRALDSLTGHHPTTPLFSWSEQQPRAA